MIVQGDKVSDDGFKRNSGGPVCRFECEMMSSAPATLRVLVKAI